jgi:hypothetical protein
VVSAVFGAGFARVAYINIHQTIAVNIGHGNACFPSAGPAAKFFGCCFGDVFKLYVAPCLGKAY